MSMFLDGARRKWVLGNVLGIADGGTVIYFIKYDVPSYLSDIYHINHDVPNDLSVVYHMNHYVPGDLSGSYYNNCKLFQ